VEVWNVAEDAEGGAIGEVNILICFPAAQKTSQRAKAFSVSHLGHVVA
jgi:hypothetical protein